MRARALLTWRAAAAGYQTALEPREVRRARQPRPRRHSPRQDTRRRRCPEASDERWGRGPACFASSEIAGGAVLELKVRDGQLWVKGDDRATRPLGTSEEPGPGEELIEGVLGRYAFPLDPKLEERLLDLEAK